MPLLFIQGSDVGVALIFYEVSAVMSGPFLSLFFSEDLSLFGAVEILFRKVGRGRASYVKLATYTAVQ